MDEEEFNDAGQDDFFADFSAQQGQPLNASNKASMNAEKNRRINKAKQNNNKEGCDENGILTSSPVEVEMSAEIAKKKIRQLVAQRAGGGGGKSSGGGGGSGGRHPSASSSPSASSKVMQSSGGPRRKEAKKTKKHHN